jgi:hypothetical protein
MAVARERAGRWGTRRTSGSKLKKAQKYPRILRWEVFWKIFPFCQPSTPTSSELLIVQQLIDHPGGGKSMHGPGEPGNLGKDADIEALLQSNKLDDVFAGLKMVDERYRYRMSGFLRLKYPGLSSDDLASIWESSMTALLRLVQQGRFKARGSLGGLLRMILEFDAIDRLRRYSRCRIDRDADVEVHAVIRFDDPHELKDLLTAIDAYLSQDLPNTVQQVLRTYVRLVCGGHATSTGRISLKLLTDEVNRAIHPRRLSQTRIRSALRRGRKELREFLIRRGFFDE